MAPRANWKGYLKLSLVSCAVALYPATTATARVSFNTINRRTGNQVKRLYVDPESGDPVETDDQVKGYKVGKGSFIYVEEDDLEAIKIESTHTIDIERFVPREQVDVRFLDSPYYIAPDDQVANEAFAVIREAMRESGRAGVARVVIARRERMILLEPLGKGLMGTVLRYPYEVRMEETYFEDIPDLNIPDEMRDLASHIIEKKAGDFEPEAFEDRYENAVVEMIKAKQAGQAPQEKREEPRPSNVVNLMDALRRSIDADRPAGGASAQSKKAASKSSAERSAQKPAKSRSQKTDAQAKPAAKAEPGGASKEKVKAGAASGSRKAPARERAGRKAAG